MQTILIVLNSEKLENPDLDIRYELPDKLERYTNNEIYDNGYDHLTDTELGIWLETQSAKENYGKVVDFFDEHMVCGNDLLGTAKIYISEKEAAPLEECTLVYDGEVMISDEEVRAANRGKKIDKIISRITGLITDDNMDVVGQLKTELCELQDIEEKWECFTSELKKNKYIYECDEDAELNEFLGFLQEAVSIKVNALSVKENMFDADNDLYEWCEVLDALWADDGYCMAIYEMENGNDVVFPCCEEKLEEISELAKEICINVMAVAEM